MADITKCEDKDCPMKESCYRFTAKAKDFWQSYFMESPRKGNECDMYWGHRKSKMTSISCKVPQNKGK